MALLVDVSTYLISGRWSYARACVITLPRDIMEMNADDRSQIEKSHNTIRSSVNPSAENMLKMLTSRAKT
nr:hypothetical protein HmN_000785900 [Hymenolepis microstoma]